MESYLDKIDSPQDESDRNEIRSELSKMTFEDLQKLKSKLGAKVYKEAMFGTKTVKKTEFKRMNKNRPREASSKVKPTLMLSKPKEKRIKDPRFDRLCGTFNEKHFENTYEFLSDVRTREKKQLKKMLKRVTDPSEQNKIEYLIQRMENQDKEAMKRRKKSENEKKERNEQIEALKSGQKPYFKTRYEKKIADLVDKYSELKKSGKIEKYIKKKQKKQNVKKKHQRYFEANIPNE